MSELVPALKDTLFSPTYEIVAEYAEIGIDALLDNEVLKGIPVVSTLSSICKIGYNLHERNLIKQTLAFITEFNSGSISQGKLNEHREKLEANPKEAEKELGRVLIILVTRSNKSNLRFWAASMPPMLRVLFLGKNFVSYQKPIVVCLLVTIKFYLKPPSMTA